jgi:hypothetical protein
MINRRRAPSKTISSQKKKEGHKNEDIYADLIDGVTIKGTQKGDVEDSLGYLHSVKSGKKWQVFLYGYERILGSKYLKILSSCLESFTEDADQYFYDRVRCIQFKEEFVKKHGKAKAKLLSNEEISRKLGPNAYMQAKVRLAQSTQTVCLSLKDPILRKNFLEEALFNLQEVKFLAIKEDKLNPTDEFKVFTSEDVLDVLTPKLLPLQSRAGNVPEDYNVAGQKVLFHYFKDDKRTKNIVEIEIRNDSNVHYRQVRFNMYSKDTLGMLLKDLSKQPIKSLGPNVSLYGNAVKLLLQ